jgi:hypothetical protein
MREDEREMVEEVCRRIEGSAHRAEEEEKEQRARLGAAVHALFELYSQPSIAATVLDKVASSIPLQDALVCCIVQASMHSGQTLQMGYIACRLFNQIM